MSINRKFILRGSHSPFPRGTNLSNNEVSDCSNYVVFRYELSSTRSVGIISTAKVLCSTTRYKRGSPPKEAPKLTDCVTAIWYVLDQALSYSLTLPWIGDLPRKLNKKNEWRHLNVSLDETKTGDLLFVKNKKSKRCITHLALIVNEKGQVLIFNCTSRFNGAVIEEPPKFFKSYEQVSEGSLLTYIDSRNKKARDKHGGNFIKEN